MLGELNKRLGAYSKHYDTAFQEEKNFYGKPSHYSQAYDIVPHHQKYYTGTLPYQEVLFNQKCLTG